MMEYGLNSTRQPGEPSVAIILVNYNGCEDSRECLLSLRDVEYRNKSIILVDNASTDGSISILKDEFPEVCCLRSEKNLGFTGGNNFGLAHAYEMRPDYVFLLNNDTTVSPNILLELTGFMAGNPRVGLAGPLTFYYDAPDVVSFGGGQLNQNSGIVSFLHKGAKRGDVTEPVIYCNFIEGAAIFARTEVIRAAGGFNDLYFLTSEESELCARVAKMHYQLAVITECGVWHKVSQTMGAESVLANYFIFRNKLWFIRRNSCNPALSGYFQFLRYTIGCLASFLLKKRNAPAAMGIIYGIVDFLKGISGPGRYKVRLNA